MDNISVPSTGSCVNQRLFIIFWFSSMHEGISLQHPELAKLQMLEKESVSALWKPSGYAGDALPGHKVKMIVVLVNGRQICQTQDLPSPARNPPLASNPGLEIQQHRNSPWCNNQILGIAQIQVNNSAPVHGAYRSLQRPKICYGYRNLLRRMLYSAHPFSPCLQIVLVDLAQRPSFNERHGKCIGINSEYSAWYARQLLQHSHEPKLMANHPPSPRPSHPPRAFAEIFHNKRPRRRFKTVNAGIPHPPLIQAMRGSPLPVCTCDRATSQWL